MENFQPIANSYGCVSGTNTVKDSSLIGKIAVSLTAFSHSLVFSHTDKSFFMITQLVGCVDGKLRFKMKVRFLSRRK